MPKNSKTPTNTFTLLNLCNQYKLYQIHLKHPPRYDIVSPYVAKSDTDANLLFTKEQLDMRRKVEILKYPGNQQNSKSNNPTKNNIWSFLNSQGSRSKVCRNNPYLKTSTTACDVPGRPIELFLDPTVPLYNYISNRDKIQDFSSSLRVNDWDHYLNNDIECNTKELTTCFGITYNGTRQGRTKYSFQTPISISLQGMKDINAGSLFSSVHEIDVQLTNIKCIPYFGDFPTVSLGSNSVQLSNYSFKVLLPDTGGDFLATKYIGDLNVSNIILFTQYQYVYELKLSFEIVMTLYDSNGNIINGQSDTTIFANQVVINLIDNNDIYYYNLFNCEFIDQTIPLFNPFNVTSNPPNLPNNIAYGYLQT